MRFSHEHIVEEEFEEFGTLTCVGPAFKSKLEQRQEDERGHELIEKGSR